MLGSDICCRWKGLRTTDSKGCSFSFSVREGERERGFRWRQVGRGAGSMKLRENKDKQAEGYGTALLLRKCVCARPDRVHTHAVYKCASERGRSMVWVTGNSRRVLLTLKRCCCHRRRRQSTSHIPALSSPFPYHSIPSHPYHSSWLVLLPLLFLNNTRRRC